MSSAVSRADSVQGVIDQVDMCKGCPDKSINYYKYHGSKMEAVEIKPKKEPGRKQ